MTALDDIRAVCGQSWRLLLWLMLAGLPAIYLLSGFYSVDAGERGVVLRFGKVVREHVMPGMHYHLPWPVEAVKTLPTTELRTMEIDFAQELSEGLQPELTTGDENLVDISILVQFNIRDPSEFIYVTADTETLLRRAAISETLYYVSRQAIDPLLTTGRTALQQRLQAGIQQLTDEWGMGVRVTSVQIRRLEPPSSIKKAFDNVARARAEKQKLVQDIFGERQTRLAQARSQASDTRQRALAYQTEVVQQAKGDHERFISLWESLQQEPTLTGQRLYYEKLAAILANTHLTLAQSAKAGASPVEAEPGYTRY